ncbi:MAG: STAS domain-containing protein [Alphaproteobacteria bacterium]|nr:STAS domain-containing protein [Alphaproteobacteria bacterium]
MEEDKSLTIAQKKENDTLYITLKGWLDPNTSPMLVNGIDISDVLHVVFDLSAVEYVFSAGLRAFIQIKRTMDEKNGSITLKNVSPSIRSIFEYTGLESMLEPQP